MVRHLEKIYIYPGRMPITLNMTGPLEMALDAGKLAVGFSSLTDKYGISEKEAQLLVETFNSERDYLGPDPKETAEKVRFEQKQRYDDLRKVVRGSLAEERLKGANEDKIKLLTEEAVAELFLLRKLSATKDFLEKAVNFSERERLDLRNELESLRAKIEGPLSVPKGEILEDFLHERDPDDLGRWIDEVSPTAAKYQKLGESVKRFLELEALLTVHPKQYGSTFSFKKNNCSKVTGKCLNILYDRGDLARTNAWMPPDPQNNVDRARKFVTEPPKPNSSFADLVAKIAQKKPSKLLLNLVSPPIENACIKTIRDRLAQDAAKISEEFQVLQKFAAIQSLL